MSRNMMFVAIIAFVVALSAAAAPGQEVVPVSDVVDVPSADRADGAETMKVMDVTHEWQRVPDGYAVPGGVEVRLDVYNGGRFARLPPAASPGEDPKVIASASSGVRMVAVGKDGAVDVAPEPKAETVGAPAEAAGHVESREELMRRALPAAELGEDVATGRRAPTPEELEAAWARRQKELAEAVAAMHDPASGMGRHVEALRRPGASEDERVAALEVLEDYCTKIDFARDMRAVRGLVAVVSAMNGTERVAAQAAWVLGTAVKADPVMQTHAVSIGAPFALRRVLERAVDSGRGTLAKKGVYAATALARGSAVAQKALLEAGAVDAMAGLLDAAHDGAAWRATRTKLANFAADMVTAAADASAVANAAFFPPLRDVVTAETWCRGVAGVVLRSYEAGADGEREGALQDVEAVLRGGACAREAAAEAVQERVRAWEAEWTTVAQSGSVPVEDVQYAAQLAALSGRVLRAMRDA